MCARSAIWNQQAQKRTRSRFRPIYRGAYKLSDEYFSDDFGVLKRLSSQQVTSLHRLRAMALLFQVLEAVLPKDFALRDKSTNGPRFPETSLRWKPSGAMFPILRHTSSVVRPSVCHVEVFTDLANVKNSGITTQALFHRPS